MDGRDEAPLTLRIPKPVELGCWPNKRLNSEKNNAVTEQAEERRS